MGLKPETVQIDKENRKLNGIVAIEPIDIKDWRPFSINQEFISDLVAAANKQKEGVKSHFGHNYANEGMLLGRASNWRVEDDKAKYDLAIGSYADKSPKMPGMGSYLLDLMSEDKEAMMNSIVFREQYFYQETKDGQKVKCYYFDKKTERWITPNPELGKVYPKFGQLYSTDIVSEGAATNSMFSTMPENETKMQKFINAIKDFFTLSADDESDIISSSLNNNTEMDATPKNPAPDATQTELQSLRAELAALKGQSTPAAASESPEVTALKAEIAELKKNAAPATPAESPEVTALKAEIADLKQKLAATPAATKVAINDSTNAEKLSNEWDNDPINVEARKLYNELNRK